MLPDALVTIGMFAIAFFVIWLMLVFLLLIHEAGHLIPMQRFGIKPDKLIIRASMLFSFRNSGGRSLVSQLSYYH